MMNQRKYNLKIKNLNYYLVCDFTVFIKLYIISVLFIDSNLPLAQYIIEICNFLIFFIPFLNKLSFKYVST